jgi:nucleoid DNA-binding protein
MDFRGALSKKEIACTVSDEMGFSKASSLRIVDGLFETMKEVLLSGEPVKVVRFGSFRQVERPARVGTDPSSGRRIDIAPRKTVVFNPGRILKSRVNGKPDLS